MTVEQLRTEQVGGADRHRRNPPGLLDQAHLGIDYLVLVASIFAPVFAFNVRKAWNPVNGDVPASHLQERQRRRCDPQTTIGTVVAITGRKGAIRLDHCTGHVDVTRLSLKRRGRAQHVGCTERQNTAPRKLDGVFNLN